MEKELLEKITRLEQKVKDLEGGIPGKNKQKTVLKFFQKSFKMSHVVVGITLSVLFFSSILYALTKPYIFSAGNTASASEVNANFDTLYDFLNSGVMVGLSTSQTVAQGAVATIAFDEYLYGNSSDFNSSSNQIEIQNNGVFEFSFSINETAGTSMCFTYVYYNGSLVSWQNNHVQELYSTDTINLEMDCTSESSVDASISVTDTYMLVKRLW